MTKGTSPNQKSFLAKHKIMSWLVRLAPPEWMTAYKTLGNMIQVSGPVRTNLVRSAIGFIAPFSVGSIPSYFFIRPLINADETKALGIMAAILAFAGLLVGFVVTLMIFTGRIENPEKLSFEQVKLYAERIKFLLVSQAMTLFSALVLSTLAILWMILYSIDSCHKMDAALRLVGIILFGIIGVCLLKVFLLPMQIFELHEESLDSSIDFKEEEINIKYRID